MDSKENKKTPEGEELNQEELDTVTGALYSIPVGGGNTGGTTHPIDGGYGGGGGGIVDNSCKETTDTNMMGCPG